MKSTDETKEIAQVSSHENAESVYNTHEVEAKWRERWEKDRVYATKDPKSVEKKDRAFVLAMFPYPSGAGLHTGHARIYTGTDVLARFLRMQGKAVLHPMGWDAFGLPAENAAIKAKKNPQDIVPSNVATFKRQMMSLGLSYDWEREINTTDPEYYAITQWLFIQFFKRGLLFKKDTSVYYCPFCKTGLALEEVLGDGTHERCGNQVEKRSLPQWIFKITDYSESLLNGLEGLGWPKGILEMQKNWIGKKEGVEITYDVFKEGDKEKRTDIRCFTTRPETNFGATFVVIAPEHEFSQKIRSGEYQAHQSVTHYIDASLKKTERERKIDEKQKTGVFTGYFALNNLNGRHLPIYISDYVLADIGTGAVVGVPGHDVRDFQFAKAMNLPIVRVVVRKEGEDSEIIQESDVFEDEGVMINSDFLDGLPIMEALEKMKDHLVEKGMAKRITTYHLRDWIFSRQRYWGEPIPMVQCADCGWIPVPEKDLPVQLPYVESYEPLETGESPLAAITDWVHTTCPECGKSARRETDTMPNWAGSCWYYLQFALHPDERKLDTWVQNIQDAASMWLPVDWYIGGAEHAVLHLMYARFWAHVLHDMDIISCKEPFQNLRNVGMVQAPDGRKMSKSLGNVINPDEVIQEYSADVLRTYVMFMAPFNQEIPWSIKSLQGIQRFLGRVWRTYNDPARLTTDVKKSDEKLCAKLQTTIQKATDNLTNVKFNTPIAAYMEFMNDWDRSGAPLHIEDAKKLLLLLAPFAPFMTEELWHKKCNGRESIHIASWPQADQDVLRAQTIIVPVQVNGKIRERLELQSLETDKDTVVKKALESERVKQWVGDKNYKVMYVEGRILSLVTE